MYDVSPPFSEDEYRDRRSRAVAAAASAGCDALLVCSRGGGTSDRHGNLIYLCNAYTSFPFIPDNPPLWSGRGHAFLLLPVGGEPELMLDVPFGEFDAIAIDRVRVESNGVAALARLLREHGLERGRLGLVGTDVLPVKWYWELSSELPNLVWVPADQMLDDLRVVKSPTEQELLREVTRRGVLVMNELLDSAIPARTKGQVMGIGLRAMAEHGLLPYDLRLGTGTDLRRAFLAHLPGTDHAELLVRGDLLRVDVVASLHGYYVDFARTAVVGDGEPDETRRTLLRAARESVYAVITGVKPGVAGRRLTELGQRVLEGYGLAAAAGEKATNRASGFAGFGHSIGVAWESPWIDALSEVPLRVGMCLSVEKKVGVDGAGAATFEEMLLVTDDGAEVLTAGARYPDVQ